MVATGLKAVVAARERPLHIAVDIERVDPDRVRVHVTERLHLAIGARHLHQRSHRELRSALIDERNEDLLVAGILCSPSALEQLFTASAAITMESPPAG